MYKAVCCLMDIMTCIALSIEAVEESAKEKV